MSIHDEVIRRLEAQDSVEFALSDTFDVKASILLVAVTFLATQTTEFLTRPGGLPGVALWMQAGSVALLVVTALLTLLALWPRGTQIEDASAYPGWVRDLLEEHRDAYDGEARAYQEFVQWRQEKLLERIVVNGKAWVYKSRLVIWSFKTTAAALVLNLVTAVLLSLQLTTPG